MSFRIVTAAALALAIASPALAQTPRPPADTGNMAYPAPLPQGTIGTTTMPGSGGQTGNMAYPAPQPQGVVGSSTPPGSGASTGSAQYPAPQPQGVVGTTTVK